MDSEPIIAIMGSLPDNQVDDHVDVGDVDGAVAVHVPIGRVGAAQNHADDGVDVADVDGAVAIDVTADGGILPIDKRDDRAIGRGVAVAVKVQIAGSAAGVIGGAVLKQFVVYLDLLSGQGSLALAVLQRLDESGASPSGLAVRYLDDIGRCPLLGLHGDVLTLVEHATVNGNDEAGCGVGHREAHHVAGHHLSVSAEGNAHKVGVARFQHVIGDDE